MSSRCWFTGSIYNFLYDKKGGGNPLSSNISLPSLSKSIYFHIACCSTACHYNLLNNSFSFCSSYIFKYKLYSWNFSSNRETRQTYRNLKCRDSRLLMLTENVIGSTLTQKLTEITQYPLIEKIYIWHKSLNSLLITESILYVFTFSWSSLAVIPSGTLCCQTSWNSDRLNLTAFCKSICAIALHILSSCISK